MHLSAWWNLFVQRVEDVRRSTSSPSTHWICISLYDHRYLSIWQSIFVRITKCICPHGSIYLSKGWKTAGPPPLPAHALNISSSTLIINFIHLIRCICPKDKFVRMVKCICQKGGRRQALPLIWSPPTPWIYPRSCNECHTCSRLLSSRPLWNGVNVEGYIFDNKIVEIVKGKSGKEISPTPMTTSLLSLWGLFHIQHVNIEISKKNKS